jgi:hypothetical protein
MDNHYHLLMETPSGNLPQIMRHINGAYTTYFNIKRDRSGHLFQGRYKAFLVEKDTYAMELSRYIHLNPVRAGLTEKPSEYEWTSYNAYVGSVPPPEWLVREFILGYFAQPETVAQKQYKMFVTSILGKDHDSPLKDVIGGLILGEQPFVEKITSDHLSGKQPDRDLPELKKLQAQPSASFIDATVERIVSEDPKLARILKIYFNQKNSGATLKLIGQRFDIGESAVSQVCRRLKRRKTNNAMLSRIIKEIEKELNLSRV